MPITIASASAPAAGSGAFTLSFRGAGAGASSSPANREVLSAITAALCHREPRTAFEAAAMERAAKGAALIVLTSSEDLLDEAQRIVEHVAQAASEGGNPDLPAEVAHIAQAVNAKPALVIAALDALRDSASARAASLWAASRNSQLLFDALLSQARKRDKTSATGPSSIELASEMRVLRKDLAKLHAAIAQQYQPQPDSQKNGNAKEKKAEK